MPLLITILLFKPQLFNHYTSINHRTHLHPSTISPPISAHILSPLISPLPPHSYPPSQPYFCPIIRNPGSVCPCHRNPTGVRVGAVVVRVRTDIIR